MRLPLPLWNFLFSGKDSRNNFSSEGKALAHQAKGWLVEPRRFNFTGFRARRPRNDIQSHPQWAFIPEIRCFLSSSPTSWQFSIEARSSARTTSTDPLLCFSFLFLSSLSPILFIFAFFVLSISHLTPFVFCRSSRNIVSCIFVRSWISWYVRELTSFGNFSW